MPRRLLHEFHSRTTTAEAARNVARNGAFTRADGHATSGCRKGCHSSRQGSLHFHPAHLPLLPSATGGISVAPLARIGGGGTLVSGLRGSQCGCWHHSLPRAALSHALRPESHFFLQLSRRSLFGLADFYRGRRVLEHALLGLPRFDRAQRREYSAGDPANCPQLFRHSSLSALRYYR